MPDARATLDRYFGAICALDAEAFVAAFAPDATQEDPVGAPSRQGHEAILGFFHQIGGLFESVELKPTAMHFGPDSAAVPFKGHGRGKNGAEVQMEGVDVFIFDAEGRIASIRAYWDPGPVLAKLTA